MSDSDDNTSYPYVMSEDITALDCDDAIHMRLQEIEATCFELAKNEQSSQVDTLSHAVHHWPVKQGRC